MKENGKYFIKINRELYKRNFELAIRNRTLTLLKNLYDISLLSLETRQLGQEIVTTIRTGLNVELVELFVKSEQDGLLKPVALSLTKKSKYREKKLQSISISLDDFENECVRAVREKRTIVVRNLNNIWRNPSVKTIVETVVDLNHINSAVIHPLLQNGGLVGVIVIAFNHRYKDLSRFEKEAIENIIAVVKIALDKASLYQDLRIANTKLKEFDRLKSEFMSIASHQLRTPLTGLIGYLSMLSEGDYGSLKKDQSAIIHELLEASQRLARMVNLFLSVTRIEAGRFDLNIVKASIKDILADVILGLRPNADKRDISLNFIPPDNLLPPIYVDVDKIKDVCINLIDNAIKYTPKGSVTVTISGNTKSRMIKVGVQDTGIGIEPREAERLFDKFVRGRSVGRIEPNGSGLGLFIAKKMIDAHEGRIWVESLGDGKGSTFYFELPTKVRSARNS